MDNELQANCFIRYDDSIAMIAWINNHSYAVISLLSGMQLYLTGPKGERHSWKTLKELKETLSFEGWKKMENQTQLFR